ncbi:MAG: hypothetical protein Q8L29_02105 [archaeon]|nr:hypothetical protein [archaeon]
MGLIDKIRDYFEYSKARRIVRAYQAEPLFISCGSYQAVNPRKCLIAHEVAEAMLTVALYK